MEQHGQISSKSADSAYRESADLLFLRLTSKILPAMQTNDSFPRIVLFRSSGLAGWCTRWGALLVLLLCGGCANRVTTRSGLDPKRFESRSPAGSTALYTLTNENGMEVCLSNYGARIVSILVPDRSGKMIDVTLGFDNLKDYRDINSNFGATIGRVCNRIAQARFPLDGQLVHLTANDGPNCLHGGREGWQRRIFRVLELRDQSVVFTLRSHDGEEGFPGEVSLEVSYTLTAGNRIRIDYRATTDRTTVINPTNHTFFNLSGDPRHSATDHLLSIRAEAFTPIDDNKLPTGEIRPVRGTPMDFSKPRIIAEQLDTTDIQIRRAGGFDHNWVLSDPGNLRIAAATLYSPTSGVRLDVFTDQPGLQFFTGNAFRGEFRGRGGIAYRNRPSVCLETQHFPDSPNRSNWPSVVLKPGQTYRHTCIYAFSTQP